MSKCLKAYSYEADTHIHSSVFGSKRRIGRLACVAYRVF